MQTGRSRGRSWGGHPRSPKDAPRSETSGSSRYQASRSPTMIANHPRRSTHLRATDQLHDDDDDDGKEAEEEAERDLSK